MESVKVVLVLISALFSQVSAIDVLDDATTIPMTDVTFITEVIYTEIAVAVADVGISSMDMTNPDDAILSSGGGQAVEFTIAVTSLDSSDDVVGAYNWEATTFLSNSATGTGVAVASESLSIASDQVTKDLIAGGSINLVGLAATYDLTDVDCIDFSYACVTLEPHDSADWRLVDSPTLDQTTCISVTCGTGFEKLSITVMIIGFLLSHLLNNS